MNFEIFTCGSLEYAVRLPKNFDPAQKYPALLFLHGAGQRTSMKELLEDCFFTMTDEMENFPFVVITPFCCVDTWFDAWQDLKKVASEGRELPYVDPDRYYIMGASMGGYATWQLAMSLPSYFAAITPICGGGMYWNAARLKDIPVWAFHGAKDPCVFLEESEKMVNAVNASGGHAKLTVYPNNEHDAWSDTYSNQEVYRWLLQHSRSQKTEA